MTSDVLSQGEIESRILDVDDELERVTDEYADLSDAAAHAEAAYKEAHARAMLAVAATGEKVPVAIKEARADLAAHDEFRAWKIAEARRAAAKEALLSLRSRLDALRTLSANVRMLTNPSGGNR